MRKSIQKNLVYQIIYEVLVLILPLITSPYIARRIGAEGLGQYSYSYSVAFYFVLFSMLGIKNYGNRVIAQNKENQEELNQTFSSILVVHILISLICCGFYTAYVLWLNSDQIYAAIQFAYVLSGLFDISWFYFGIEKFKLTVITSGVVKLLNVVCIFAFVRNEDDLWKYCSIMAVGMLLSQVLLWIPLKRYVSFVKPHLSQMFAHVKPLVVLFIPAVAISLYKYMDKIMIGTLSSKIQLGLYENAEKIINVPTSIIGAFGTVMLPKMSYLAAKDDKQGANRYIMLSMKYVMCLAFALTFGVAAVGQIFAPLFWGDSFADAGPLIMGLALTVPFISFANVVRTQYLIPQSKDTEYTVSVIAGAVVNLIINGMLIPSFGAMGATIGTIAAEMLVCIIQTISVRRQLPIKTYCRNAVPFSLLGVAMFAMVYGIGGLLNTSWTTLLIQIVLGFFFYVIACAVYFWIIKDEIFLRAVSYKRKQ